MRKSMMRRLAPLALALGLAPATALAQETPKAEVFIGYSNLFVDRSNNNVNGFDASVAGNITRSFAIEGEASGYYAGGSFVHTAMAGPRYTFRGAGRVRPFAHLLAGAALFDSSSANTFAMAAGGGLDVRVNDRISIRAVQADYVPFLYTKDDGLLPNFRVSTGIVFTIGQK